MILVCHDQCLQQKCLLLSLSKCQYIECGGIAKYAHFQRDSLTRLLTYAPQKNLF